MKTLHLFLGSSERRLNSRIEAAVLDLCYNRAAVQTTRAARLKEFIQNGCAGGFEVMILVADQLLDDAKEAEVSVENLVQSVWVLKNRCSAPLLVLGLPAEMEYRILEAGADVVLSSPLNTEELKAELERLMSLPEPPVSARQAKWSLAAIFGRNG